MKALIGLVVAGLLAGCGTINTVFRDDAVTSDNLKEAESFCGAVPRVYSGVVYDFCLLHGKEPPPGRSRPGPQMGFVAVDIGISAIFDTLMLPYTLYRQHNDGGIEVVGR
ncbi:YceK/YidQ family lipoprotein [Pseudomonas sp. CFBP 8770]|uniref:YceK/YidQ family lipoprotein n=1 Tax=unclassified Pseudomonas TaxID=196821 RepID=UPI00178432CE|nr:MULTISPECIES: YceK/YidQ family lipoprotein [unclassified Pseudomonas]MBD8472777.1 YceK/YidQ family lipoprotein [Pseudomonas sp. CFBP 8773]MBD8646121.1 YceK/YidQ family lipoprotein [Pseudomonas sp. CFBP 8770]